MSVSIDKLANAYDRLAALVGAEYVIAPTQNEKFTPYLKDYTYMSGVAGLVLRPASAEETLAIVAEAKALRRGNAEFQRALSLTLRGGGSGLSGACVPEGGIVLDLTRLQRVLDIDEKNFSITAECGIILAELNSALSNTELFYAVDPSSEGLCTLGGSIATNAAGPSSLKYGTTRHNLARITWLNADAACVKAGALPVKTSLGISLPDLLCGSEGRLGIVLDATLRLVARPEERALLMTVFSDAAHAADFVRTIRLAGIAARAIEIIDDFSAKLADFPLMTPQGGALLMIELDGRADFIGLDMEKLQSRDAKAEWVAARDAKNRESLWAKRKSISVELTRRYPYRLGEDIAVPLSALAYTMQFARAKASAHKIATAIWGHAGDGNLHVNYLLEDKSQLPVLDILLPELAREVTRLGGAMSGEHGLGRLKRRFARQALAPEYFVAQDKIKQAFDRDCLFNPALEDK
ncbi:MAG: FAD-binding oxidoreductase [Spirochaetes bacterium]|nr:FAD-binding oxidoreductase [Spirochaetota bacterium]